MSVQSLWPPQYPQHPAVRSPPFAFTPFQVSPPAGSWAGSSEANHYADSYQPVSTHEQDSPAKHSSSAKGASSKDAAGGGSLRTESESYTEISFVSGLLVGITATGLRNPTIVGKILDFDHSARWYMSVLHLLLCFIGTIVSLFCAVFFALLKYYDLAAVARGPAAARAWEFTSHGGWFPVMKRLGFGGFLFSFYLNILDIFVVVGFEVTPLIPFLMGACFVTHAPCRSVAGQAPTSLPRHFIENTPWDSMACT
eukprot:gnl/TRDRNA2_/TRDRNA2_86360_c0_seq4.p1 gnl/TRDRNA2_/TRDRNA2_86360_c0~~gnl/TRDRNA2_/TRDRNA2_86360_c0_seq4.p1  ORF type:complete len:254 (+),score=19.28 gnl/TRDRNA2_/TRDRNA2_86360_c0_seq4:62-823(+)